MTTLRLLAAQFEALNEEFVSQVTAAELAKAARPFAPAVRAAIINTPSAGGRPWPPQVPGLRLRIAACVKTWAEIHGPVVTVGVEMDSSRMPDGQKSLPLMLEGEKIWRHPVFGNMDKWVGQESHPYFWGAVSTWGPATHRAVERAADNIAARITD